MSKIQLINLDKETLLTEAEQLKNSIPELQDWDFTNQNDVLRFVLDFYLEQLERTAAWANALSQEFNIATAFSRDNIIDHATQLGYVPDNRVSANVGINITHNDPPSNTTILAGELRLSARGRDGKKVYFENENNFTLLNGSTNLNGVSFVEGRSRSKEFTSNGNAFQTFTITDKIADSSLSVEVDGTPWTEIDTFEVLGSSDERYRLRVLNLNTYQVIFGNGTNGKIPNNGATITLKYREGGGQRGNVGADTVTNIEVNPEPSLVTEATNPSAATGGVDPESIDSIRYNAVRLPRTNSRLVSINDIEAYGDSYTGVKRTKAYPNFTSPLVYIIPDGGGLPSSSLKSDLQIQMNDIIVLGNFITVLDPNFVTVNLTVNIVINPSYVRSTVESNAQTALENLLDPLEQDSNGSWKREFGEPLKVSEVVSAAISVNGVMAVEIQNPTPTVGSDILVDCNDDEIINLSGSTVTINSELSKDNEATTGRSIKTLYENPKYKS